MINISRCNPHKQKLFGVLDGSRGQRFERCCPNPSSFSHRILNPLCIVTISSFSECVSLAGRRLRVKTLTLNLGARFLALLLSWQPQGREWRPSASLREFLHSPWLGPQTIWCSARPRLICDHPEGTVESLRDRE